MLRILGGCTMAALTMSGATATPAQAHDPSFAANYTCNVPVLGARPVTIHGSLSPSRATAGVPTRFRLHIGNLSLQAPIPITAWTAAATIDVTGPQRTSFTATGTGTGVAARKPITGDLRGTWTPRAAGTAQLWGGNVTIQATVTLLGRVTAYCVPRQKRTELRTVTIEPNGH